MGFALCEQKVGGSWVCCEGKGVRRKEGKIGVRRGEEKNGDGLLFFCIWIISQPTRENRGFGRLRPSQTAWEILVCKEANEKHQKPCGRVGSTGIDEGAQEGCRAPGAEGWRERGRTGAPTSE